MEPLYFFLFFIERGIDMKIIKLIFVFFIVFALIINISFTAYSTTLSAVITAANLAGVGTVVEAGAVLTVLGAIGVVAVTVAGAVMLYQAYKGYFKDKEGILVNNGSVTITENAYKNLIDFKQKIIAGQAITTAVAYITGTRYAVPSSADWIQTYSLPYLPTGNYRMNVIMRQYYCYPWQQVNAYFVSGTTDNVSDMSGRVKVFSCDFYISQESGFIQTVGYTGKIPNTFPVVVYRSDARSIKDLQIDISWERNTVVPATEYALTSAKSIPLNVPIEYNPPLDDSIDLRKLRDMYYIPALRDTSIAAPDTVSVPNTSVPDAYPGDRIAPPDTPDLPRIISKKFPFSLPFDLKYLVSLLDSEPRAPRWGVTFFNSRFDIDMSVLDPVMPLVRKVLFLGSVLGVLFVTRKLLGGAE